MPATLRRINTPYALPQKQSPYAPKKPSLEETVARQCKLMGMELAKKGRKWQVQHEGDLLKEFSSLRLTQQFLFSLLPVSLNDIAKQTFSKPRAY